MNPLVFRSGISNAPELAYIGAGCAVGSSLARTNTNRAPKILNTLLTHLENTPVFLDNGLIQFHNQNKPLDNKWVLNEYLTIAKSLRPFQRKNLFVVIPDDVHSPENALQILKDHKATISALTKLTNVIIPIHRCKDIRAHVQAIKSIIRSKNLIAGIPCLTKPNLDFALSVSDIDAILSEKRPSGEHIFRKCHFFGMSETTNKSKLTPRLLVAHLHGLTSISMDANRTTATFGQNRIGTKIEAEVVTEHEKHQVLNSDKFTQHDFKAEFHVPENEPFVTNEFYSMINEDEIFGWLAIFNQLVCDHPHLVITETYSKSEISDLIQLAWDLTSQKSVDHLIFNKLKSRDWGRFKGLVGDIKEIAPGERRYQAIEKIFMKTDKRVPVQMSFC